MIGPVLALAALRRGLLAGREVGAAGTWDCGYAQPTARMQYTSSSYVQPALEFFAPLLRTRGTLVPPSGLFPTKGALATETPDLAQRNLYRPVFGSVEWLLSRLRWLQLGHVHIYVLYIGITVVALLVWFLALR